MRSTQCLTTGPSSFRHLACTATMTAQAPPSWTCIVWKFAMPCPDCIEISCPPGPMTRLPLCSQPCGIVAVMSDPSGVTRTTGRSGSRWSSERTRPIARSSRHADLIVFVRTRTPLSIACTSTVVSLSCVMDALRGSSPAGTSGAT